MKRHLALWIGAALSFQASAGYVNDAKINQIRVQTDGSATLMLDRNMSFPPACVGPSNAVSFNVNSSAGKAIMEMALSAKERYASVTIEGAGTCSTFPQLENVGSLTLE